MDTYNLTYNELQKNIIQVRKKHFPNYLASLAFIRERVIMMDTGKNPGAIFIANLAFTGAIMSNMDYLMA